MLWLCLRFWAKKVLTKHDLFCYNDQAVSERATETGATEGQRRTLKTIQRREGSEAISCEESRKAGAVNREANSQNSRVKRHEGERKPRALASPR